MRPQQQNRRIRGRGNSNNNNNNNNNNAGGNNRKGPNPLTRTYESNGPDVKIRGTAQQIADKYAALARDAHSSGDRIMVENYLQHAEHYNRIIATAQAQLQISQPVYREQREDDEENDVQDDVVETSSEPEVRRPAAVAPAVHANIADGSGPQPQIDGVPAEVALNERHKASTGRVNARRSSPRVTAPVEDPKPAITAEVVTAQEPPVVVQEPEIAVEGAAEAVGEEKPVRRVRRPRVRKPVEAGESDLAPTE